MKTVIKIVSEYDNQHHATASGSLMHKKLQFVTLDGANTTGDAELVNQIQQHSELVPYFSPKSRVEVPIAGFINNRFVSRRIDRLLIDDITKTISILDYKTDTNRETYRTRYERQISEYIALLRALYPDYTIHGYILWTHDFFLDMVT